MEGKQFAICEDLSSKGAKGAEWCGKVFSIYQKWPNSVLHRVRWEEAWAVRVPFQPKPPEQLSSPAGAIQQSAGLTETLPKSAEYWPPVSRQLCMWYVSVEEGHVVTLSFRNFSLETQDVCEFDYVEVHDSADTGAGRVLGR